MLTPARSDTSCFSHNAQTMGGSGKRALLGMKHRFFPRRIYRAHDPCFPKMVGWYKPTFLNIFSYIVTLRHYVSEYKYVRKNPGNLYQLNKHSIFFSSHSYWTSEKPSKQRCSSASSGETFFFIDQAIALVNLSGWVIQENYKTPVEHTQSAILLLAHYERNPGL